jgi:phosphatidylglycerophosphate synthase
MERVFRVGLADSSGPTVLGMRVRDRNARVAARAGALLVDVHRDVQGSALLVPDHVVLETSLFPALRGIDPPCRLRTPAGATLDWGEVTSESPQCELDEEHFLDVSDADQRRRAERLLLFRTMKETDGPVSRRLNRPLSRFFSRWLLKAGLGPNVASAVSLALGVACGIVAAQPGSLSLAMTGVLFQFASMFDGVDGEMARVMLRDSKVGAAIDAAADNLTYLSTLLGFAVGWAREGISEPELWLLGIVAALVVITLIRVFVFVRGHAPDASFVFFDRTVRRAAHDSGSVHLRWVDLFFRATRRDLLALILMFVSFFGSRLAIVCLVGLGVLVVDYVLLFHRNDLARAARHLGTD